jgi:hypothetical protein
MSYYEKLMLILKNIPEEAKEKIFSLWADYKSIMDKIDRQIKAILPDSLEQEAIAEIHETLANVFLHLVLKVFKEAKWYTRETFDVTLAITQKLFIVPGWVPDWWDESYPAE